MSSFSLTGALLASDDDGYRRATQSQFLRLAANGQASKEILGRWLANDRLYIHSYIRGIGRLISFLQFPDTVPDSADNSGSTTKLLDWLVGALVNIRREEKFFVKTAAQYGIEINLETDHDGRVPQNAKLEGLQRWEALFDSLAPESGHELPWLEAAVVYWGTEKCYLDAWSWAKAQLTVQEDASKDKDGGALRNEFIDNWTSKEFSKFVDELGTIINEVVQEQVEKRGESAKHELFKRAEAKWVEILIAETAFWPNL
ncbi:hypothetical protein BGZ61DRAFT_441807 [Ilyonectria robusta]|uniref:uncharacterized protein n=1 Tax=Ilyonectria robusta TaxID=1079257 RepID=UPI001E8DBDD6|nr:uncharacterized protein BGZ61DRAFT_441807 [Ilyonectria robusta]KAH8736313.1 hypothetical protein BGZ61DRAFT_441807 [Ilyonectria robusta]